MDDKTLEYMSDRVNKVRLLQERIAEIDKAVEKLAAFNDRIAEVGFDVRHNVRFRLTVPERIRVTLGQAYSEALCKHRQSLLDEIAEI